MSHNKQFNDTLDAQNSIEKHEINLQFHWYALGFGTTYLLSWLFPGIIIWMYIQFLYIPYFLNAESIIIIFSTPEGIIASVCFPIIIIISYLIHLFFVAAITKFWWKITERISTSKNGIIPRNIPSKTLNLYHIRSFLIKYPKHAFNKGPFPWLIKWLYNFVGCNKIGKGSVIEEQFGADKGIIIGENSYIGVNSGFSSHAVDGIFGDVSYFKIKVGDNVTTSGLNCLAPGVEINDDSYLLPMAGATKHNVLKGENYYFGVPLRRAFSRKVMDYLDISEDDLKKAENLKERRKNKEEEKNDK
jgi:acetyltransferase-like isoleucine patch superfamily enzyme